MPRRAVELNGKPLVLDARPDRLDLRDLPYRPPVENLPPIYPTDDEVKRLLPGYLQAGLILDQKNEGACTGFGLAAVINFLRWLEAGERSQQVSAKDVVSPRMLYHLARFYDEWPGEDYEGSSCRGALKGWHRHGVCLETLWPYAGPNGGVRQAVGRLGCGRGDTATQRILSHSARLGRGSAIRHLAGRCNLRLGGCA